MSVGAAASRETACPDATRSFASELSSRRLGWSPRRPPNPSPPGSCSSITFFAQHLGFADIAGMFLESAGSFTFDEDARELSDLRVVIRTDSVFTGHERRDRHLRGGDFLNVEAFPEMIFEGRRAAPHTDTTGQIEGDLTLLGITQPTTLEVTFNKAGRYLSWTSTTRSALMPSARSGAATRA